jgi:hypothetical protein
MAVRIGDRARHRPATHLVELAFRSFAEDRAEERDRLSGTSGATTRDAPVSEHDYAKSAARRPT